ncbi:hypothetical protein SFRURICE_019235 [Spodoptera frugiperda]|nr:hypothetical protein SFRURICE_019235 [Spodoptera frugiperda]
MLEAHIREQHSAIHDASDCPSQLMVAVTVQATHVLRYRHELMFTCKQQLKMSSQLMVAVTVQATHVLRYRHELMFTCKQQLM